MVKLIAMGSFGVWSPGREKKASRQKYITSRHAITKDSDTSILNQNAHTVK
jgi:hypothetical protein